MARKQKQDGDTDDQAEINDEADAPEDAVDAIEQPAEEVPADVAEPVTEIDTRAEVAPEQPKTFSAMVRNGAHDAQRDGDAARHALLHNLYMAVGDFKRAAAHAENALPECDLRSILADIRNRM